MALIKIIRDVRLGAKTLLLHKLRSLLTMLGVVFGVASVIAMLAVGEGASREALDRIRMLGSTNIMLESVKPTDTPDDRGQRTRVLDYGLRYEDERRIREHLDHVQRTAPVKEVRRSAWLGERNKELRVVGTTWAWFELVPRPIIAGRILGERDMDRTSNVVVLTEHGARRLLATEQSIGSRIRIVDGYYEVIGIVQNEEASGETQIPDSRVDAYIPLPVARERFTDFDVRITAGSIERERGELHRIIVQVDDEDNVETTAAAIQRMLELNHPNGDFTVQVPLQLLRQREEQQRIWNWTLASVAGISLLVGGIGIMNIMLASVTERTREIGVRRAIGAKKRQIVSQFLIETLLLAGIGGLVGIAVGPLLADRIESLSGIPTIVPTWAIALSVGISMTVGVVFGLYPAARAANLDPIVALRHE